MPLINLPKFIEYSSKPNNEHLLQNLCSTNTIVHNDAMTSKQALTLLMQNDKIAILFNTGNRSADSFIMSLSNNLGVRPTTFDHLKAPCISSNNCNIYCTAYVIETISTGIFIKENL